MNSRALMLALSCACLLRQPAVAADGVADSTQPGRSAETAAPVPQPKLGIFINADDIARARRRVAQDPWARAYQSHILSVANAWVARSDDAIRQMLPKPGALFAYGAAGCPHCGKAWQNFACNAASLDRPFHLYCPHCNTDINMNAGPYADSGEGVVINGKRYWFRATWNSFVTNAMWASDTTGEDAAIPNLAFAYALTGDARYAHKAIVMMDALATISPTTSGPIDLESTPGLNTGRLHQQTTIFYRAQMHLTAALDLVANLPELQTASPTNQSLSIWENIHQGLYEDYLFKLPAGNVSGGALPSFHNHVADNVRSLLLTGVMFGNADYVRWGAQDLQAFLEGTIDRDGLYYETALLYIAFTRSVFIDSAEVLARYRPELYPAAAQMPALKDLPWQGNFFNHPRLARLTLDIPSRVSMLGREPSYGDSPSDDTVWQKPGRPVGITEYLECQRFASYATQPEYRQKALAEVTDMYPSIAPMNAGGYWRLFRATDVKADPAEISRPIATRDASDFLGQSGLVMLRGGQNADRRGLMMRVGPSLNHSHDEMMAPQLYAHGRELTYNPGYRYWGNHAHLGWAQKAIAQNTVVINQDEATAGNNGRVAPGGTINRFGQMPGVSWVEGDQNNIFEPSESVHDFRRTLLMVDLSPTSGYWVDLFDVDGGCVQDYSFHTRPLRPQGSMTTTGVKPEAIPGVWTLAGLDPAHRNASFNQPGQSWGERATSSGMLNKLPGLNDIPDTKYWFPTPGTGYGYIYNVKGADTTSPWSADWKWQEKDASFGLRMTMLPESRQQVLTATAPNVMANVTLPFVIVRHGSPENKTPLRHQRYTAVFEAYSQAPAIDAVTPLNQGDRIVGLRIRSGDREDLLLDARRGAIQVDGAPPLASGMALIRYRGGKLDGITMTGAPAIEVGGVRLNVESGRIQSRIVATDDAHDTFKVSPPLPASAAGSTIVVNNSAYTHGSAYRVAAAGSDGLVVPLNTSLVLARAKVQSVTGETFVSSYPIPYGFLWTMKENVNQTRFMHGKRIVSGTDTGHVARQVTMTQLQVAGMATKAGESFAVYDVQAGDTVWMDSTVALNRDASGEWNLQSNVGVTVGAAQIERLYQGAWQSGSGTELRISDRELAGEVIHLKFTGK